MPREKKKLAKLAAKEREKRVPAEHPAQLSKNLSPREEPDDQWFHSPFKWSQRTMDEEFEGDWDWRLTPKEAKLILSNLEEMSAKTWREIASETAGKKGRAKSHAQPISDIVREARDRLAALEIETEELYRVRIGYSERLWGYRIKGCFHVLWYDRNHMIYDD